MNILFLILFTTVAVFGFFHLIGTVVQLVAKQNLGFVVGVMRSIVLAGCVAGCAGLGHLLGFWNLG